MQTTDLTAQRWFGSKSQDVADVQVLETVPVDGFELAIVEVSFHPGTHELYQLALRDGEDGVDDPEFVRALARLMDADSDIETADGPRRVPPHRRADRRDREGPRDGRRAVQLLAGARRADRAEGLPPPRRRARTRSSRCCASSPSAASSTSPRCAAGTRTRGRADRRHARDRAGVRARLERRLGPRARGPARGAGALRGARRAAGRGHRARCTPRWPRTPPIRRSRRRRRAPSRSGC